MRHGSMILGIFIIVLILIAGCTSSQGGASTGSKSQKSGSGSSITTAPTPDYSLSQNMECSDNCPDMDRFVKFFPDLDGWRKSYPQISRSGPCVINERYDEFPDSNHQVTITIQDFSPCNYGADFYLKKIPAGEISTGPNGTMAYTAITYHGFPTLQIKFADKRTSAVGMGRMIVINPKLSIEIDAGNGTASEVDAEIEKFTNTIDFNGIAMIGNTGITYIPTTKPISHTISVTPRYNQDGTITITNNGGPDIGELSFITVSVNGANLPANLDAKAGSVITAYGIAGSKNRVIAIGTFKDGVQQIVLDTYVGK